MTQAQQGKRDISRCTVDVQSLCEIRDSHHQVRISKGRIASTYGMLRCSPEPERHA
jgi:hypothetical protein